MKRPMDVLPYSHKDKLQGVLSAGSTYTNHTEEANGVLFDHSFMAALYPNKSKEVALAKLSYLSLYPGFHVVANYCEQGAKFS